MNKISLMKSGYYRVFINGKYVRLHRYLLEQYLLKTNPVSKFLKNKKLRKDILVHHIDGNKTNNELSNLECVDVKKHSKIHLDKYPLLTYNEKQKMWHTNLCICGSPKNKYRKQCKNCYINQPRLKGKFCKMEDENGTNKWSKISSE